MDYTTITFDIGDTLFQVPGPAPVYREVLALHGRDLPLAEVEWIVEDARRIVDERVPRWVMEDLTLDRDACAQRRGLHVDTVLALAGVADPGSVARDAFMELYVGPDLFCLYPDALDTLSWLKTRGYRLGVISNWEPRLQLLCAAHGIDGYFDFMVVSELEGYFKPHPELFRRALERGEVTPERVLHVGDRLREDIEGAASVGIRGVLLDRRGEAGVDYQPRIGSLSELCALLAA